MAYNGVPISDGFVLNAPLPLDRRLMKETLDELNEIPEEQCYNDMRVYVKDQGIYYRWDAAGKSFAPVPYRGEPTAIHCIEYDLNMTGTTLDVPIEGMTEDTLVDVALVPSNPSDDTVYQTETDKFNDLLSIDSYEGKVTFIGKSAVTGIKVRMQWYVPSA